MHEPKASALSTRDRYLNCPSACTDALCEKIHQNRAHFERRTGFRLQRNTLTSQNLSVYHVTSVHVRLPTHIYNGLPRFTMLTHVFPQYAVLCFAVQLSNTPCTMYCVYHVYTIHKSKQ